MKVIIAIFLFLFFVSCNHHATELELLIVNKEVVCVDNVDPKTNEEIHHILDDSIYGAISKNILTFKLRNNSDKKYFIVLNEDNLTTLENDLRWKIKTRDKIKFYNQLAFNLYNDSTIVNGKSNLFVGLIVKNVEGCFDEELKFVKDEKKLYTQKITIDFKEVLENGFVLYPNETAYFTSIVNLPIRLNRENWQSLINKKTNYASLTLVNHREKTEKMLSENQRKEIEENGYVIFDGIVESNKIPIRMISMHK